MKNIVIIGFGGMGKRHGHDMEGNSVGRIGVVGIYEPDDVKDAQGCDLKSPISASL